MAAPKASDIKPVLLETADPAGTAAEAAVAPRQAGLSALNSWLLVLVCLFQTSLLVSWFMMSDYGAPQPSAESPAAPAHAENTEKHQVPTAADAIQLDPRQGEKLLREGDYAQALPYFWPSAPAVRLAMPDFVQFRAALCLEALGYWPEALESYRGSIAKTADAQLSAAAQVAQARVHVRMNHPVEAKNLLFPLVLLSGQHDRYEPSLLLEARYLLGLALSQEAFADQRLPGLAERPVSANAAGWIVGQTLDWLTPVHAAKDKSEKAPANLETLRQYGLKSEEVLLRGTAKEAAVAGLVEKLAGLGKLTVTWSPPALQRIQDRTASVAVDGMPLLDLLNALLDPLGLLCQIKEGSLQVGTAAETPQEIAVTLRTNAARQALRQAMFSGPDHPLAATAYLELGNDEAVSGKLDEAVSWYERLLAESTRSPHLSAAYYNLGLVQRARKNSIAARKAFYRVVDRDPGHELAPRALVQIGWTFLADGQALEAIFPLRQAVGMAQAPPADAEAILALGTAYLLNGNPRDANTILNEGRKQVNRDPWRITAAFLDALARQRVAASGQKSRLESADLLAALLAFQSRPALGSLGQLLVGQAYKDLGMPQQMAKVFEESLPSASGPAAAEMSFCLAEQLWSEGKREPALKLLTSLSTTGEGKWSRTAQLRLAAIALAGGQPQQCLTACTALLQDKEAADRPAVLRLMGTAYEQLGELQKAARCYAGELPD